MGEGKKGWNRPPKVDPEAVLQLIRSEGLSIKAACERAGISYNLFTTWRRRGKFDLAARIEHAKDSYSKKLALNTAAEFDKEKRPRHLVAFLEQFKRTGEQIDSCRFAGFSYRDLQEFCDEKHIHYNWWFATEFDALLEEQRQELRDKAMKGGLSDPRSAAQLLRDIERIQRPPAKEAEARGEGTEISDDQILEALERIAAKVNESPELPPVESGSLQVAPS